MLSTLESWCHVRSGALAAKQSRSQGYNEWHCLHLFKILPFGTKVFQPLEPCAAFIPGVLDIRNTNAMKQALELSPGFKLPSTSHTQKCSKEHAMTSMQNIVGPPRGSDHKYYTHTGHKVQTTDSADYPCAREPTPCRTKDSCFIPDTDNLIVEPTLAKLCPVYIEPSGAFIPSFALTFRWCEVKFTANTLIGESFDHLEVCCH